MSISCGSVARPSSHSASTVPQVTIVFHSAPVRVELLRDAHRRLLDEADQLTNLGDLGEPVAEREIAELGIGLGRRHAEDDDRVAHARRDARAART